MSTPNDETTIDGLKAELARIRGQNRELLGKFSDLETENGKLARKAETAETLAKTLADTTAKHAVERGGWDEERGIYQSGLTDPEAIDVAKHLYSKMPEAGRPALGEWVKGFTADPTKAPRALSPYLAKPADAEPKPAAYPEPKAAPNKAAVAEGNGAGAVQGGAERASGSRKWTHAETRAMRDEAVRTGDWKQWEATKAERESQANDEIAVSIAARTGGALPPS